MAKDLDDIFVDEDDLTPRQEKLLLWRDYFELLQQGLVLNNGDSKNAWSEELVETSTWLNVVITELEGDVMHLEGKQERFCRWDEPTDLAKYAINE